MYTIIFLIYKKRDIDIGSNLNFELFLLEAAISVSCDGSEPLPLTCSAPVLRELQAQVALVFQEFSDPSSILNCYEPLD